MQWGTVGEWLSGAWCWLTDFERGTLAGWVSGVGSLAAAGTALWLAYDAQRGRLKLTCKIRSSFSGSVGGDLPEEIVLFVENNGQRETTIRQIKMCVGKRSNDKKCKVVRFKCKPELFPSDSLIFETDPLARLSDLLKSGGIYKRYIPLGVGKEVQKWVLSPVKEFISTKKEAKTVRFVLCTDRREYPIKRDDRLVKAIVNAIDQ